MERVGVGLIGAGWVAVNRHLPALQKLPEVDLRLVWSRNPDKARSVASRFGVGATASCWQDVIHSPKVDAVIIATPPVLHMPATLAALRAQKHVLCQARMARNLSEAQEMLKAARTSRQVTALYPPLPGLKGDRVMIRLLHEDKFVGDICEVRVTGLAVDTKLESYQSYRWDPQVSGLNTMTLGMWNEVVNRWLGPTSRLAALAQSHRHSRSRSRAAPEMDVPDSVVVAAQLGCGATASYHFSNWAAASPGSSIEIYGTQGALVYHLFTEEIRGLSGDGNELKPIPISRLEQRFQDTDSQFIRAILDGSSVEPTFQEGLEYMQFLEAVALSLKLGQTVSLPVESRMQTWGRFMESGSSLEDRRDICRSE